MSERISHLTTIFISPISFKIANWHFPSACNVYQRKPNKGRHIGVHLPRDSWGVFQHGSRFGVIIRVYNAIWFYANNPY